MTITRTFSINPLQDILLPTAGGTGADPSTAVFANGGWATAGVGTSDSADYTVVTFFDESGVQYAASGGPKLSNPAIADVSDLLAGTTRVAVAATNDLGHVVYKAIGPGGSLANPIDLGLGSNPDVTATGGGSRVAVAFQYDFSATDSDIALVVFDANGGTVKTVIVDGSDANDQNVAVAYAGGRFVVTWNRIEPFGATSLWYASYDTNGKQMQSPTLIDASGSINRAPCITETGTGFAISYEDNQSGDSEIKTYFLGSSGIPTYSQTTKFAGNDGEASLTRIDNLYVTAFTHSYGEGEGLQAQEIRLSIVDQDGNVLTDPTNPILFAASGALDSNPQIADFGYEQGGRFIVSYQSTYDGQIHQQLAQLVETITGDSGKNTLSGLSDGIAIMDGGGGDDTLIGGSANDVLKGGIGVDQMGGGRGNDTYYVDNAADQIFEEVGSGAMDWVKAAVTFDLQAGVDVERLSTTNDKGTARINLYGNEIAQEITGNAGDNILSDGGKGGSDTLIGLGGNDTYRVYNSGTKIVEAAAAGSDTVEAAVNYTVGKGVYIQILETTNAAGKAAISLYSNEFGQTVNGNAGDNVLRGYGGNDIINGGDGADKISGGLGNDTLAGNAGADTYYFSYALNASTNVDTINGFSSIDLISLSSAIFTKAGPAGALAAGAFWASATGLAHDASDRIIWETDTGILRYDPDGTGVAAPTAFAIVTGNTGAMNAGDFVIA